ncbi:MAG TPA: YoaK family protein [Kribbella sp.]|uniref:YoaK family protein n=1 Tax=Kribbella sp. TaxID=1871183 RepID=UPI002D770791|nr:YoaK family protein [Kribbella sp.]HET6293124.1 YoaK family protein [Kribbella sp.]
MAVPVGRRWEVAAFLSLTVATGLVDAVSYLALGHTFVANMTGNVVFLGFALSPDSGFTIAAPLVALVGFLLGSLIGGRTARALENRVHRWLGFVFVAQALVIAVVALLVGTGVLHRTGGTLYVWILILATCFGSQNATVRRAAPRDMTTTVLTLTLTGLAADGRIGGGKDAKPHRRFGSVLAMFAGAGAGALLLQATTAGVLVLAALAVAIAAAILLFAPAPAETP